MKRKSDEHLAREWLNRQAALPSRIPTVIRAMAEDAYLAGLLSERRANKQKEREQAETLRRLLTECRASKERTDPELYDLVDAQVVGIRECIKALGFSEKGGSA